MNYSKVNVRYAKAIFLAALEQQSLEQIYADFTLIQAIAKENKEFRFFLNAPIYNPQEKKQFISQFFQPYVSKLTFEFLNLLTEKRRESRLFDIIRNFFALYKQHHNIVDATLVTPLKLDENLLNEFKQKLEPVLKKQVHIKNEKNADVIGGFILRVEDMEFDASIKNKLNKIKINLEKHPCCN
jgi:F-type H+-transporting ATPase subunit delta